MKENKKWIRLIPIPIIAVVIFSFGIYKIFIQSGQEKNAKLEQFKKEGVLTNAVVNSKTFTDGSGGSTSSRSDRYGFTITFKVPNEINETTRSFSVKQFVYDQYVEGDTIKVYYLKNDYRVGDLYVKEEFDKLMKQVRD